MRLKPRTISSLDYAKALPLVAAITRQLANYCTELVSDHAFKNAQFLDRYQAKKNPLLPSYGCILYLQKTVLEHRTMTTR